MFGHSSDHFFLKMLFYVVFVTFLTLTQAFEFENISLALRITDSLADFMKRQCVYLIVSKNLTTHEKKILFDFYRALAFKKEGRPLEVVVSTFENNTLSNCENSLSIVLVGKETKNEVEKVSNSLSFTNSGWLFFINSSIPAFFDNVNLNIASGVLAINSSSSNNAEVWEVFRVTSHFPLRVLRFAVWSCELGFNSTNYFSAKETRDDMEGLMLNIVAVENWPGVSFTQGNHDDGRVVDGFFAFIWYELAEILNFKSNITQYNNHDTSIVEAGIIMNSDLILTELNLSPERLKFVDFLIPLHRTSYQVYFKLFGYQIDWLVLFRPFGWHVWICILFWLVVVSLLLFAICSLEDSFVDLQLDKIHFPSPTLTFLYVLQTICQQGSSFLPKSSTVRLLILICYLFSTLMLPFYSASLISSLTKKQPTKPFDALNQVENSGIKLMIWEKSADATYFLDSKDSSVGRIYNQSILRRYHPSYTYREMYKEICSNERHAAFAVEASMDSVIFQNDFCDILKFTKPVSPVYQSIAFKKKSPFKEISNLKILWMWEIGILSRANRNYLRSTINKRPDEVYVSLHDVITTLSILIFGIIISLAILIIEILDYKNHEKFFI